MAYLLHIIFLSKYHQLIGSKSLSVFCGGPVTKFAKEKETDVRYSLSANGNCPICRRNIKYVDKEYTIFKSKPVLIYEDRIETKCPNCNSKLVDK